MTTAHRPTWKAAVGKTNEGGFDSGGALSSMRSSKDVTGFTKLKVRGSQELSKAEIIQRSLKALEEAEGGKGGGAGRREVNVAVEEEGAKRLEAASKEVDVSVLKKYDDGDDDGDDDDDDEVDFGEGDDDLDDEANGAKKKEEEEEESDLDADDDDSDSDEDDSDSDEDEEAALAAELAKIRAEKDAAKRQAADREAAEEEAKLTEAAMLGNPLLQSNTAGSSKPLKRRWNDDIVFKNQARKEPKTEKRFINDTVRNDFHKRFMDKFMK